MRQKLISLLLAAAMALPMTGCVQIAIVGGEDGPTEILIGGPAAPDQSGPGLPGEDEPSGAPEESPQPAGYTGQEDGPLYTAEPEGDDLPEEDGTYNSAEDVSLYLYTFGHLPDNYITKNEARDLGWTGGSVERYAPGCAIGGDKFGNREGVLPEGTYHECDIDTIGESSRGAKRLVYADDGRIYYTEDHYETFELLYGEE